MQSSSASHSGTNSRAVSSAAPKQILDHWHPVLPSARLGAKPVEVELAGRSIAIYRETDGRVSALGNRCPHRGMKLSFGKVGAEGLSCLYHGWTFAADGSGRSPCNPRLKVKAEAYDVREAAGFVWLSGKDSGAVFPDFIPAGFAKVGVHVREVEAPLEPVMDNFLEVEHFPTAHSWLKVDFRQISESELVFASSPERVQMGYYPAETLDPLVRWLFRLPPGSRYFMDISANTSPLHTIHHQGWLDPASGRKATILINAVFYVPINQQRSLLVMFLLAKPGPFSLISNAFIRKETGRLIDDDMIILNNLADKQMRVSEMRLGYYDKALIEVRKRLPRIYADYYPPAETVLPMAPDPQTQATPCYEE